MSAEPDEPIVYLCDDFEHPFWKCDLPAGHDDEFHRALPAQTGLTFDVWW